jgi:hypothetical protein
MRCRKPRSGAVVQDFDTLVLCAVRDVHPASGKRSGWLAPKAMRSPGTQGRKVLVSARLQKPM